MAAMYSKMGSNDISPFNAVHPNKMPQLKVSPKKKLRPVGEPFHIWIGEGKG